MQEANPHMRLKSCAVRHAPQATSGQHSHMRHTIAIGHHETGLRGVTSKYKLCDARAIIGDKHLFAQRGEQITPLTIFFFETQVIFATLLPLDSLESNQTSQRRYTKTVHNSVTLLNRWTCGGL